METIEIIKNSGNLALKLGAIVLLALYFVYAFIIVKQVNLMTQTLDIALKKPLKYFAVFHLLWATISLLYSIVM